MLSQPVSISKRETGVKKKISKSVPRYLLTIPLNSNPDNSSIYNSRTDHTPLGLNRGWSRRDPDRWLGRRRRRRRGWRGWRLNCHSSRRRRKPVERDDSSLSRSNNLRSSSMCTAIQSQILVPQVRMAFTGLPLEGCFARTRHLLKLHHDIVTKNTGAAHDVEMVCVAVGVKLTGIRAPALVALERAQVCDHDDDGLSFFAASAAGLACRYAGGCQSVAFATSVAAPVGCVVRAAVEEGLVRGGCVDSVRDAV
jgi:hypothetical protein